MTDSVTGVVKLSPAQLKKSNDRLTQITWCRHHIPMSNDPTDLT